VEGIVAMVFLCHSSGDKGRVRALYKRLTDDGVPCWLDAEDIKPGQDWDLEIRKAIRASRYVLVCLSRESIEKVGYVQKEVKMILNLADHRPEGAAYVFPVKLEECELPESLSKWQAVNLYQANGYRNLKEALG
jgi:TIR domain